MPSCCANRTSARAVAVLEQASLRKPKKIARLGAMGGRLLM
jgi:hypothetical protein